MTSHSYYSKEEWQQYMREYRKLNRAKELASRKRIRRTPKGQYASLLESASRRGLQCDITFEQYRFIRNGNCTYCNGALPESCSGLDRIDNSVGYLLSNVTRCCKRCTLSKHSMSQDEFRIWIEKIHAFWCKDSK